MGERKSSAKKIELTPFDKLFQQNAVETVQEIALAQLQPFHNHPFKVVDDEEMNKLVESIAEKGVVMPAIARPLQGGGYELISGHRRKYACEKLGLDTMPVLVRELEEDEAVIIMVDSNVQREHILPSEKAFSYKMKLEAIKYQGERTDLTSGQVVQKLKEKYSVEVVADEAGESYKQIQRFIRLTELLPTLLEMVDKGKLKLNPAVELSYLLKGEQEGVLECMETLQCIPSLEQAKKLKKYSQEKKLNESVIEVILSEATEKGTALTLKKRDLKQYFPKSYSKKDMETVIFELLKQWQQQQNIEENE